jgi:hypothetical protein
MANNNEFYYEMYVKIRHASTISIFSWFCVIIVSINIISENKIHVNLSKFAEISSMSVFSVTFFPDYIREFYTYIY